jgi:hypothetical protein
MHTNHKNQLLSFAILCFFTISVVAVQFLINKVNHMTLKILNPTNGQNEIFRR